MKITYTYLHSGRDQKLLKFYPTHIHALLQMCDSANNKMTKQKVSRKTKVMDAHYFMCITGYYENDIL